MRRGENTWRRLPLDPNVTELGRESDDDNRCIEDISTGSFDVVC